MLRALAVLLILACAPAAPAADLAVKKALTLEIARQLTAAAQAEAKRNNWNVCVAIVDEGGFLISFERMDDTQLASVEIALYKARSAALFRRPTKAFEDQLVGGRQAVLGIPGAAVFEGGLPIIVDGKTIGAIGVSGVTSPQDGQIGKAAIDALPRILGK